MAKKQVSLPGVMFNLIGGRWVTQMIYVVAALGIADLLADGPRSVEDLANAAGAQAQPLYRVLRCLASRGIFEETKPSRFKLTPLAATLRRDVPGSMRALALMTGSRYQEESWSQLLHGVKTGETPFRKAHGIPYFEYLEKHPDDLKTFSEAMTNVSMTENLHIAAACKLARARLVVDVGGGNGSLLRAILEANPKLRGVHFDQPLVSARARQDMYLTAPGVAGRCEFAAGSFFESVPPGGDAYLIKRVLHDWSDDEAAKILGNCRAAMNPKGVVLVMDSVILPGNSPDRGKLLDVQMLAIGGRERAKRDFAALFKDAGLRLTRVILTKSPLSIVEAVRA
jgi:O-methyltransferase